MRKIIVAIDGYSSTGKSTVARQLANCLGYRYIDSGAMYRAITLFALQNGCIQNEALNADRLIGLLPDITVDFRQTTNGTVEVFLNNQAVEQAIRTLEVARWVSPVAALPQVRHKLVSLQQQAGIEKGIVMDGRDIGTVVFPKAELKIFMTASAAVRAQRRYDELLARGLVPSLEEVAENLARRDHIDTTREDSPLVKAADAIEIDNTHTNQEDQLHIVLQLAKDRIAGRV